MSQADMRRSCDHHLLLTACAGKSKAYVTGAGAGARAGAGAERHKTPSGAVVRQLERPSRLTAMAEHWKRPESVPFPSVWRRCTGLKPMEDGKIPSFWIQDITEDLTDGVVDHMTKFFLQDETICSSSKLRDDPVSLREIQGLWRHMIKQRAALVALTEGENGPVIAGCNVTGVVFKADKGKAPEFKGDAMRKVIACLDYIGDMVDPFERYGVDKYMTALGLSVDWRYRGQGLGIQLLRARFPLGRAIGLPLTVTVFTAIASQVLAHRIGMELLAEVHYADYIVDGQVVFPDVPTKSMKLMAKRIEEGAEDETVK